VILLRDFSMRHYSVIAGPPRIQANTGINHEKSLGRLMQTTQFRKHYMPLEDKTGNIKPPVGR
jgi:hypothetical protein